MKPGWRLLATAALAALLAACGSSGVREHSPRRSHAAPAAERSAGAGEYQVRRGDTLYSIAFRNQLDFHDLAAWNNIGRDYTIYPGRVLRLTPPGGEAMPPPRQARVAAASTAPAVSTAPAISNAAAASAAPAAAAATAIATAPPPEERAPADMATAPAPAMPAAVEDMPPSDGHWTWPTRGSVVRRFGVDGSKGLDLSGQSGQVVVAAAGGKVVYSGSALKGYGELIIVKHDETYLSAYGYNRRRLVEEGQQVQAGQPIAEMGLGPEQQPMLHFEIRDKGRPVDPMPLLPRM
ncbi:MAG: peptidoglycan DD-metalloendopeptidase family protein [Nevskia sp.]|nr:peptidoglycan DD-metalloendopeptidase family protein [Nevskia sp.]